MYKRIKNIRYDTALAKPIGRWENGHVGEPDWVSETLYNTRSGAYFIHAEGGEKSKYAEQVSLDTWSKGEAIVPCALSEARRWAMEHLKPEEYRSEVELMELDEATQDEKSNVTLSLSLRAQGLLAEERSRSGRQKSAIVEDLILKGIRR